MLGNDTLTPHTEILVITTYFQSFVLEIKLKIEIHPIQKN
jgi:hypothetical protein